MSQVGMRCVRGKVPFKECRACSLTPLHPCDYSAPIIQMMHSDAQRSERKESSGFSATMLNGCDRRDVLRTGNDWYGDVDQAWKVLRGTMVHSLIREQSENYPDALLTICEERFSVPIETKYGTYIFSGQPDMIAILDVVDGVAKVKVLDWKTTGTIGHDMVESRDDNVRQINMYGYLLSRTLPAWLTNQYHGLVEAYAAIESVEIVEYEIFYSEMKKARRFTSSGTLTTKGKMTKRTHPQEWEELALHPIPKVKTEVIEKWIIKRIEEKIAAKETLPPILEGDAAWVCAYCPVYDTCMSREKEK